MPRARTAPTRTVRVVIAATVLAALSGCATTAGGAAPAAGPELVHVHGLAVVPDDPSAVYAAAHSGVWRIPVDTTGSTWVPSGEPEQIADRDQDTMGFTVTGTGTFLASGHPDPTEHTATTAPHLGLVSSDDRARTWRTLALEGQVDFHDLETAPLPGGALRVLGYDATRGVVMTSDDGGATWRDGATLQARDLTLDPRDPAVVYATTAEGTMTSTDAGATFAPLGGTPSGLLLIDAETPGQDASGGLTGIDVEGRVWTTEEPQGPWTGSGRVAGAPAALTVVDGSAGRLLLVADHTGVHASTDGGETLQQLTATGPGEHS